MRVRARGLKDQRCAHTAGIGGNRGNDKQEKRRRVPSPPYDLPRSPIIQRGRSSCKGRNAALYMSRLPSPSVITIT